MSGRRLAAVLVASALTVLSMPAVVSADTCCANRSITLRPSRALPGDTVRLEGIACLASDNTGPLALNLAGYWLSTDRVEADASPGDVPGSAHLAADLPPVDAWLPFASVSGGGQSAPGVATVVVPKIALGSYQLWWLCDNGGGLGSGIHYSGGSRLIVGSASVDTATAGPGSSSGPSAPAALLIAIAATLTALRVLWPDRRRGV